MSLRIFFPGRTHFVVSFIRHHFAKRRLTNITSDTKLVPFVAKDLASSAKVFIKVLPRKRFRQIQKEIYKKKKTSRNRLGIYKLKGRKHRAIEIEKRKKKKKKEGREESFRDARERDEEKFFGL